MSSESRKRPHLEDGTHLVAKKRALSSATDSPVHVNGTETTDEPRDENDLEHFRKSAIFRRMKHYARQCDRGERRIAEVEHKKTVFEAEFAAIDACWNQVVDSITLLVKREDLPLTDNTGDDLSTDAAPNELVDALRKRMRVTQQLVAAFVKLAGQTHPVPKDDVLKRCQTAEAQCASLRSELNLTRSKLNDVEEQRVKIEHDLFSAESRADRLRSQPANTFPAGSQTRANGVKEEEIVEDKPHQLSPPAAQPPPNGVSSPEDELIAKALLESRDAKIVELEKENAVLRGTVNTVKNQVTQLPEETITNTPAYRLLLEHSSKLEYNVNESQNQLNAIRDELLELQTARSTWEASVLAASTKEVEELKATLKKRDDDNNRLRQQRDQHSAELNERKVKVFNKASDEFKTLAESRSVRIIALESEVQRLRTHLAAVNGNEDLVSFLTQDFNQTSAYTDNLKARLHESEARCRALNKTLSELMESNGDIAKLAAFEANARQRLQSAEERLAKYEAIFGVNTQAPAGVVELAKLLDTKEEELRVMRLTEAQRVQAESALYVELEKLSSAWETLDNQVKNRVFDLGSLEERLNKMQADKAKSDNKFFAAMRQKEASDVEKKNVLRNLEKQSKIAENAVKSEKTQAALAASLEKEVLNSRRALQVYSGKLDSLEKESAEWRIRAEGENKRVASLREQVLEREKAIADKNIEVTKLKEDVMKAKREAEKATSKFKILNAVGASGSSGGNGPFSGREVELQSEVDKCMRILKCSTCQNAMRSTVITKCMHSFCKGCVDARISHRQRKCPACNLPFSQSDVQTLFFQ